jgi:hypothetical protein
MHFLVLYTTSSSSLIVHCIRGEVLIFCLAYGGGFFNSFLSDNIVNGTFVQEKLPFLHNNSLIR